MAEAHIARIPDDDVQREREQRDDQDFRHDVDQIVGLKQGRQRAQDQDDQAGRHAGF